MTSIDDVQDLSPRVQYTASASQTEFDFGFPIFTGANLTIDVDGVTKTLTTDYTVSGAGNETGGTVTFVVAMSGDEVVTIYRDIAIERDTDVQQNGPWSSTSYNNELDKMTLILQEIEERVSRCLHIPTTAVNVDGEMTPFATYLDKFVGIDASGVVTPKTVTSGIATDADQINLADAGSNYAAAEVEAALAELASTSNTEGASIIGLEDSGGFYAATDVEAALAELASTSNGEGASIIGFEDAAGDFAATDVEAALAEVGSVARGQSVFKTKGVVTTRGETTTLADDPVLAGWSVKTGSLYTFEGFLVVYQNVGNFKFALSAAGGFDSSAIHYATTDDDGVAVDEYATGLTTFSITTMTDAKQYCLRIKGFFSPTINDTLNFKWAQETSNANTTNLFANSWIEVRKAT